MTTDQKKELETNKLVLCEKGTDGIPAKLTHVGGFSTGDLDEEWAEVYAYTDERKGKMVCTSFLVKDCSGRFVYYYRDFLFEIPELVSAIKARNALEKKTK